MQVTRQVFAVVLVLAFVVSLIPATHAVDNHFYYCDGSDGAITRSGGTNENEIVQATTYTIDSGVTVTTSTQKGIMICATESITINGSITVDGVGQEGGIGAGECLVGGSQTGWGDDGYGPGGRCSLSGGFPNARIGPHVTAKIFASIGADEANMTGAGGGGGSGSASTPGGGGGGGGGIRPGGRGGDANGLDNGDGCAAEANRGGAGGGYVVLMSPNVTIASAATVTANGSNGPDGAGNCGGAGGGAGGLIYIITQNYVEGVSALLDAVGGDGGNGDCNVFANCVGGAGGATGGAGTDGASATSGSGGGGGGGGGAVIKRIAEADTGPQGPQGDPGADGRNAGVFYNYLTDTAATDPGSGNFKFDSITFSAVTRLRISETDSDGNGLAAWVAAWDDSTTTALRGTLTFVKDADPASVLIYSVTGAVTDQGTWAEVVISHVVSTGTWNDLDDTRLFFTRTGNKGDTGSQGPAGVDGADGADGFNSLITSTAEAPGANCADGGRKVDTGLDNGDGAGTARDGVLQSGEIDHTFFVCDGADGATGATGAAGRDAGAAYLYQDTITETDPGAGNLQFDSLTFSAATELYISETDNDANGLAAWIASWDDSTNPVRGTLIILGDADPSKILIYHVTGGNTDNGAWVTVQLTHVASSGPFTDTDPVKVHFSRTGDKGDQGPQGDQGPAGPAGTDGADGFNSLHKQTAEPAGANCAAGGFFVEVGLDNGDGAGTARDGILQSGEVDDSFFVCHGEDGNGTGNGTGNVTVNSLIGILPSMTAEETAAFIFFFLVLLIALWRQWLFVAVVASMALPRSIWEGTYPLSIQLLVILLILALWAEAISRGFRFAKDEEQQEATP